MSRSSWPPTRRRRPASTSSVADLDAVPVGGGFRVPQEAGVDAGVAERQGLPVDPHRPVVQRADQVFGRVLEREQVAAVLPAVEGRRRR